MVRQWVWLMAIGLVLADGTWNSTAGVALDLTKLKSVCVKVETLSSEARREFGLSREAIKKHVYVWLKGKLPRLRVERFTGTFAGLCDVKAPTLFVTINLDTLETTGAAIRGYYGSAEIQLWRIALWESGNTGHGIAYDNGSIIGGPSHAVVRAVNEVLNELLTDFAAEYYKAGNP